MNRTIIDQDIDMILNLNIQWPLFEGKTILITLDPKK